MEIDRDKRGNFLRFPVDKLLEFQSSVLVALQLKEKMCQVIRILLWHVPDWRVGEELMLFLHHPPFAKFFQFVSALWTPWSDASCLWVVLP